MVLKFLGIGKKSEFFMEAPPADSEPAAKAKPAAPEPSHRESAAPGVESNGKTASKPGKASKTLKEANAEKKAQKEAKTGGEAKAEPAQAKSEVKPVAAAPAPAPKAEPVLTNFATTLQLNSTPRRRPGPSLNGFKEMAKKVNSSEN
jgi:hypothetical protein